MLTADRLRRIRDWAAECGTTPVRLKSNRDIFHRIAAYVKDAESDEELYGMLLTDFPAWCAAFLNGARKMPLILAPWQARLGVACGMFPFVWVFACRKSGKTRGVSAFKAWDLCRTENRRSVAFAPTEDQAYAFGMLREDFGSGVLRQILGDGAGGKVLGEEIILANGSRIVMHGLALAASKGTFSLGEYGDDFLIDEFQLVPRDVYTAIIEPMRFDAYSRKTTVYIGTPDLAANPTLDQLWEDWQKCPACGKPYGGIEKSCGPCGADRELAALSIPDSQAISEGCVDPREVARFRERATPDEIAMMLECRFPSQSERFYDRATLYGVASGERFLDADLEGLPQPEANANYAIAVDWAKEHDRTEILVADVSKNELHYRFWRRIFPKGKEYSEQRDYVKRLFERMRATWIVVDATSVQDVHIEELTRGERAIPPSAFYRTSMSSGEARLGYHASTQTNFEMHRNHKLNIVNGKIRVSHQEPMFLEWVKQHNQLEKRSAQGGAYVVLDAPRNGFKDLAVVSAMLSLRLRFASTRPSVDLGAF